MEQQQYTTHRRIDPLYHAVTFLLTLLTLVGSIVYLVRAVSRNEDGLAAALLVAVSLILLLFWIYIRRNPLIAQDRAIRAEEQLRHYVLTGRLLDPRLTIRQIVALRFASDAEFPALAERAAQEKLSPDAIKKAVQAWRPDLHRV